jgi:hypothetical protein
MLSRAGIHPKFPKNCWPGPFSIRDDVEKIIGRSHDGATGLLPRKSKLRSAEGGCEAIFQMAPFRNAHGADAAARMAADPRKAIEIEGKVMTVLAGIMFRVNWRTSTSCSPTSRARCANVLSASRRAIGCACRCRPQECEFDNGSVPDCNRVWS